MSAHDPVDLVLSRVPRAKHHGGGADGYWMGHCPAHDDDHSSLSIRRGDDGRALVNCHAGCNVEMIVERMGLQMRDLFVGSRASADAHAPNGRGDIVAEYDYVDAHGELLYQAVRLEPKTFRLRRPDGRGGWTWSVNGVQRVLYRLPDVMRAVAAGETVFVVEGEKDADRLGSLGLVATTNPAGAGKWSTIDQEPLRGAIVCIIPDNDEPGREHARDVAVRLESVAADVRILELPLLPPKGDVSDWLNAGHSTAELSELAYDAPIADRVKYLLPRKPRLRILTDVEIEQLPKPEWLVDDLLPRQALAVLFGPPGAGKSFIAVDLAMSIASGIQSFGRSVKRGDVIYIAPEGAHGLGARVHAWKQHHGFSGLAGVHFITCTVSLLDPDAINHMIETVRPLGPVVVFVDTLARSLPGGDENSAQAMGVAIALADLVKEELGATVVLIHHTNASGDRDRGSTALRGAADTMLQVTRQDGVITLECSKQKDSAAFERIDLQLVSVADSAVITADSITAGSGDDMTETRRSVLGSLRAHFLKDGATATEWAKASGVPERRFYEIRTWLCHNGFASTDRSGRGARYMLTDKAKALFTAVTADHCEVTAPHGPRLTAAAGGFLNTPAASAVTQQAGMFEEDR